MLKCMITMLKNQIICVKVNITMCLLPAVLRMNLVNTIKSLSFSPSHTQRHMHALAQEKRFFTFCHCIVTAAHVYCE